MCSSYRSGRARRATRALAALPLLALLLLSPARTPAAMATGDLRQCTDRAWADYNSCLVWTATEWERTGCDVGFSTDYALCWARYLGAIRALLS